MGHGAMLARYHLVLVGVAHLPQLVLHMYAFGSYKDFEGVRGLRFGIVCDFWVDGLKF